MKGRKTMTIRLSTSQGQEATQPAAARASKPRTSRPRKKASAAASTTATKPAAAAKSGTSSKSINKAAKPAAAITKPEPKGRRKPGGNDRPDPLSVPPSRIGDFTVQVAVELTRDGTKPPDGNQSALAKAYEERRKARGSSQVARDNIDLREERALDDLFGYSFGGDQSSRSSPLRGSIGNGKYRKVRGGSNY